jgi:hypothetical protein
MKIFNSILMMGIAAALTFSSCKKEDTPTPVSTPSTIDPIIPSNYIKVGETYIIGAAAKAVIYAEANLSVGYQKLYTAMFDSVTNKRLTNGHFDLTPVMDMGTMVHSSPVENIEGDTMPSTQFWQAAAVFTMAGNWKLNIQFHNHKNNLEGEGEAMVNVNMPTTSVMKSFIIAADDSAKVFVSLLKPNAPKIGLNDFEITLHKKANMMSFPAVENYTVEINPIMPSMGHGSPNNVNPVHTANGHYLGKVNFTMTGLWRVNLIIKKNGVMIDNTQFFDITL